MNGITLTQSTFLAAVSTSCLALGWTAYESNHRTTLEVQRRSRVSGFNTRFRIKGQKKRAAHQICLRQGDIVII